MSGSEVTILEGYFKEQCIMARVASTRDTGEEMVEARPVSNYNAHRSEVEKPYNERAKRKSRSGDDTVDRKYHFTEDEKARMIAAAQATGGIVNPLSGRVGAYWGQVEALIQLGVNEYHSFKKVRDKMESIMTAIGKDEQKDGSFKSNAWVDFFEKPTRDGAAKPKEGNGRIEQNFKVLQRLPKADREENNPYGYKLAQFGMCVDIEYREVPGCSDPIPYYRLNTTWPHDDTGENTYPIYVNPKGRKRSKGQPKAQEIEEASVQAAEPATGLEAAGIALDPQTLPPENNPTEFAEVENSLAPEADVDAEQAALDAEPCRVVREEEELVA